MYEKYLPKVELSELENFLAFQPALQGSPVPIWSPL